MKTIELVGYRDAKVNQYWLWFMLFLSIILVVIAIYENRFTLLFFVSVIIASLYTRQLNIKQKYLFEFGDSALVCKNKAGVLWHIPYVRLSHIALVNIGSGSWYDPKIVSTVVYTNDGDSFALPLKISDAAFAEVNAEIQTVKAAERE